jgi:hypothetical protein
MNAVLAPFFDHSLKPVWGADSERIWRNGACHEVDILLAPRPPARRHSAERALSTFPSIPFQFCPLHFIHYIVALISLFYLFFPPSPFPRLLFLFPPPILFLYIPPVFKVVIYIAHFRVQLSLFEFPRKKIESARARRSPSAADVQPSASPGRRRWFFSALSILAFVVLLPPLLLLLISFHQNRLNQEY